MPQVPTISVLMPVYNGEKYLRPAIESILSQTYTDFEFIIINDGSTDSSEAIILSYQDARIRYVRNEQNLKLIATLNKGLDLCRGKYIARMDADDISFPERFARQVVFMEEHPEYGLCGTDISIEGRSQSWIIPGGDDFIRFCFLFHNPLCHPTAFIRASIVREHHLYYPAEYIHAEEYVFWIHLLRYTKAVNLPEKLLRYRLHPGQVSSVFRKEQSAIGQRIRLELLQEIALFSTEGVRKVHLVIVGMISQKLETIPYQEISLDFGGWATARQLRMWLLVMRVSLLFRKKWDSVYLRMLMEKVREGLKRKLRSTKSAGK